MRNQLKLRWATPEDTQAIEWLEATPEFDRNILSYPTTRVLCSYNSKPVAYLPMQNVLMLETLAVDPGTDLLQAAQAARDLVKGAEVVASSNNMKEIYFLCTNDDVTTMATNHGFEVLEWKVARLKL